MFVLIFMVRKWNTPFMFYHSNAVTEKYVRAMKNYFVSTFLQKIQKTNDYIKKYNIQRETYAQFTPILKIN